MVLLLQNAVENCLERLDYKIVAVNDKPDAIPQKAVYKYGK